MKKHTKIILGVAGGAIALATVSAAVVAKERIDGHRTVLMASGDHHGSRGWRGQGKKRQMVTKLFHEHDMNQDGAVTQAEVNDVQSQKLAKFDADKNGTLSLQEFEGLWLERMRSRMVDGFQRLDEDGNGTVTSEEFLAPFSKIISRHDLDNDGDVDEEELNKLFRGKGKRHHDKS